MEYVLEKLLAHMSATSLKRTPSPVFPVNSFCEYRFFGSFHSSIRPDMFYKFGLLKNFGKLAGKHLCRSFFFLIKLYTIKPATLLKRDFSADFLL